MSKGGSKTTESTQKNIIDPAYLAKWNDVYGIATDYASQPYQAYTGDLVSGFSAGQNAAYGAADNNLAGAQGLDSYGLLGSLMGQNAGTVAGADLSAYMNPYTDEVVNRSLGAIDDQRKKALHGVGDQAQSAGAFGGDRQAILEGETNRQYADLSADTAAGLYQNAYQNAQNMAQQDVTNRLNNISQQGSLAQLGIGSQNDAMNNLFNIGLADQATQQAMLDAAYGQYIEERDWDKNNAAYLASILQGMPYNSTTSKSQMQGTSSSPLSTMLGIGSMALGIPGVSSAIGGLFGGGASSDANK